MTIPSLAFAETLKSDVEPLTRIMTRAFDDDTRVHLGQERGGPPGYDNGDFFRKWLFEPQATAGFNVLADGELAGAVIVWIFGHGRNVLGTVFLDPIHQNRGLGTRVWRFVEAAYPQTVSWSLDTPVWSARNRHFYEHKCGFREDRIKDGFVFYRKAMHEPAGAA
jgi:GNAT superfamily N-acetyltransferase